MKNILFIFLFALLFVACGVFSSDPGSEYNAATNTLKDFRDGQTYKTVKIGTQVWMAENLNYEMKDSYCLDCSRFGRIYEWRAALKACPAGWHLPSNTEFKKLFRSVGRKRFAGKSLKSKNGWDNGGNGTDAFGFSALATGYMNLFGSFYDEGRKAGFWSSSAINRFNAYYVDLNYDHDAANLRYYGNTHGFSVRCLKDDTTSAKTAESLSSVVVPTSSSVDVVSPTEETVGFMTDSRDGQTYKTVQIGSQTWMAQNLNYKTEKSYCYRGEAINCSKYGRLYKWVSAVGKSEEACGFSHRCSLPVGNIQGVCPSGWHLPSTAEFITLFKFVGGVSTAGKVLKSNSGWCRSGNGTDAFGFSAISAAGRSNFGSYGVDLPCGLSAQFWSSTEDNSYNAYSMSLNYEYDDAALGYDEKNYGFSVRCLKDDSTFGQTAESSSSVVVPTSSSVDVVSPTKVTLGSMTDSRDGQIYKTVQIGSQTWMAQNLNYKTERSYCYNDSAANCAKYGRLYRWSVATTVCPQGWHLPTQTEWNALFTAAGGASVAGSKLKSTSGWSSNGNGSDDFSFSALPTGYKIVNDIYDFEGDYAQFWSSTECSSKYAYIMYLSYYSNYAYLSNDMKFYSLSVRCLKD